MTKLSN